MLNLEISPLVQTPGSGHMCSTTSCARAVLGLCWATEPFTWGCNSSVQHALHTFSASPVVHSSCPLHVFIQIHADISCVHVKLSLPVPLSFHCLHWTLRARLLVGPTRRHALSESGPCARTRRQLVRSDSTRACLVAVWEIDPSSAGTRH